jgi:hypothetical protein
LTTDIAEPMVQDLSTDTTAEVIEEARKLQQRHRRRFRTGFVLLLVIAVIVALVILAVGATPIRSPRPLKGSPAPTTGTDHSSVVVPRFDDPTAMATNGTDVWVVNLAGNSITEFNAATGSQVRIINAKADAFHHPAGITVQGSHIWVTNSNEQLGMGGGNYNTARYSSVTELNVKNGALVRVIDAKGDGFLEPGPIAVSGSHVWVLNQNASSFSPSRPGIALIELNTRTGSLVHVFKTNVDGLSAPLNLTASRSDVWLSDVGGPVGSVTEINSQNGSLVRIIEATRGQLGSPDGIAVSAGRVWVENIRDTANSVAEIKTSNGSFVRVIKARADRFNGLFGIAAQNSHVWVTNGDFYENGSNTNTVTELDARTGSLQRIIKLKDHGLYGPTEIVAEGSKLWVLNVDSVTELNQRNGSVVQVVR